MNKNESTAWRIIRDLDYPCRFDFISRVNWIGKVTNQIPSNKQNITMLFSSVGTILILYAIGRFYCPVDLFP